jgi:hypothetical protein
VGSPGVGFCAGSHIGLARHAQKGHVVTAVAGMFHPIP